MFIILRSHHHTHPHYWAALWGNWCVWRNTDKNKIHMKSRCRKEKQEHGRRILCGPNVNLSPYTFIHGTDTHVSCTTHRVLPLIRPNMAQTTERVQFSSAKPTNRAQVYLAASTFPSWAR